jgi:hypothetical protein
LQSKEDIKNIKEEFHKIIGSQTVKIEQSKKTMNKQTETVNSELSSIKENLALVTEALRLFIEEQKQKKPKVSNN